MDTKDTSWNNVAGWYDDLLSTDLDSYQSQVILPNILRLMSIKQNERVLDLACGSGFFSGHFVKAGADLVGVDLSPDLVDIARKNVVGAEFKVSSAEQLSFILDESTDKIALILAIQNIEQVKLMLTECKRVLKKDGHIYIVMNHPSFRVPKRSSWGFDEKTLTQYRRIDAYLSESKEAIIMNPGSKKPVETISFHRPLQYYFKLFDNTGFAVTRLEEWISHKKSEKGPRQKEEDRTRKEIPLFLFIEITPAN